jgi:hypothetical protein
MSEPLTNPSSERKTGKVVQVFGDYGFIACEDVPDQDFYFKTSWYRGYPPLQEGDTVTFVHKQYGSDLQAHYPIRVTDDVPDRDAGQAPPAQSPSDQPACL